MMNDIFVSDLVDQAPLILDGLMQTVWLALVISVTGFFGGIVVFYFRQHGNRIVSRLTAAYISFFVGMPLIVLLFLMYYGLPQWGLRLSPPVSSASSCRAGRSRITSGLTAAFTASCSPLRLAPSFRRARACLSRSSLC